MYSYENIGKLDHLGNLHYDKLNIYVLMNFITLNCNWNNGFITTRNVDWALASNVDQVLYVNCLGEFVTYPWRWPWVCRCHIRICCSLRGARIHPWCTGCFHWCSLGRIGERFITVKLNHRWYWKLIHLMKVFNKLKVEQEKLSNGEMETFFNRIAIRVL